MRILVVDDNEEFCQNVKDILELEGYLVLTAYDGSGAIELVRKEKPDLVLMDVKLPKIDGLTAFKKIREISPHTPVIMMTAYAEEVLKDALREGAFGVLKKPLELDKLISYLEESTRKGTRVLVVDDDRDFCAAMKDMLEDKGYQVALAYDGNEAIAKAREKHFDAILLDVKLPYLSGLETCLAIREIRPDVTVIMVSGYPQEMKRMAEQAAEEKLYVWLEKPVDRETLLSLLERTKV